MSTDIQIEATDEPRGFRLSGELDLTTAPQLEQALADVEPAVGESLTLDLSELRFMDSIGIRVLLAAAQRFSDDAPLVLLHPAGEVQRVLEVSGLVGGAPGMRVEL